MRKFRLPSVLGLLVSALCSVGTASAGARTSVDLAGRDDSIPKLGRPGVSVRVAADAAGAAKSVTEELERELAKQVHTRTLVSGDAGDYELAVSLAEPHTEGTGETIRFEAVLSSARGERLWHVGGRTDVDGVPQDGEIFAGISRNVIAALVHDGWLQARYDPENPPPQAPTARIDGGAK
jgi:hypothetical protein